MAQLAVNKVAPGSALGVAALLAPAAGGGDSFQNTGKETVLIKNAGGAPINLTIKGSAGAQNAKCNYGIAGTPAHDITVAIPNDSAIYELGPFPTTPFSDGNGLCQLAYSGVTSVTVAVKVAPPNA